MSIINSLKKVRKQLFHPMHPMAKESVLCREMYAMGYTMLVCVNGHPSEQSKEMLQKFVVSLDLPEDFSKRAMLVALRANEEIVLRVLQTLQQTKHKILFMLDLYQLVQNRQKITDKEQEFLVLFEELLTLSYEEVHFIRSFRVAMQKKDHELAARNVQSAIEQSIDVPIESLNYFLTDFTYYEQFPKMTLLEGQKRQLKYPTLITGNIFIGKGAELDLNGVQVTFAKNATITVDGGLLLADGASLTAMTEANQTMLSIRNVPMLKMANVTFSGANNVRALELNYAKVELESCTFEKCFDEERGGAIYFTNSDHFVVKNCTFHHSSTLGKGGALYIAGTQAPHMLTQEFFHRVMGKAHKVKVVIEHCRFVENRAAIGGALYMYDADIRVANSTFEDCSANGGGAAIDALNCELEALNNMFRKCKTASDGAVVLLSKSQKEDVSKIGAFERCEPRNLLLK